jgi:hypothetical protein
MGALTPIKQVLIGLGLLIVAGFLGSFLGLLGDLSGLTMGTPLGPGSMLSPLIYTVLALLLIGWVRSR